MLKSLKRNGDVRLAGTRGCRGSCIIVEFSKASLKEAFGFDVFTLSGLITSVLRAVINVIILIRSLCVNLAQEIMFSSAIR